MEQNDTPLKGARLERCWDARFVSEEVGVSLSTYRRWEAGRQAPNQMSLQALCRLFGMSAEELGFSRQPRRRKRDQAQESYAQALLLWTLGIDACWQHYMSGWQEELERSLSGYLANLTRPTLTPGPDQKTAAGLMAQVYQLSALLKLQRGDFVAAQADSTQALVYSQLAGDWNMYVASQIRLATILSARKRIGSALNTYNEALRCVNTHPGRISPLLQSWIFAGLGEIQATMGREQEALRFLQLALAVFPAEPENDPCYPYTRCDRSLLFSYEGLIFLRLGQPKAAWDAFAQIDELRPPPPERVRAEFLKHRVYTSCVLGNMIQSCIYLEAAVRAAREIGSDLVFGEIYTLYEHMTALWGGEPRVRALAQLFQR
ncbi:MAG: helix-turn-helix domain-containing protein [Ktedonobacteraceae bacterium]|nr:helix-turn-helix domain-containing protein [Ktedonobacteraceae bacterium]MBO0792432.1 helix-turn-helix domain-containing protein [Ktedonobacteraceae bacterium]